MLHHRRPGSGVVLTGEYTEKRSRFLAVLQRAETEAQARNAIAAIRREHPDARHHCSAFRVGALGDYLIERSNDDGEPTGTAGTPMLEVVRGAELVDVVVVVVRWFGGTKLGTGGLVRAYTAVTAEAVNSAVRAGAIMAVTSSPAWVCEVDHTVAGRLESELRSAGVAVLDTTYGRLVRVRVAGKWDEVAPLLATLTAGEVQWQRDGTAVREEPVES